MSGALPDSLAASFSRSHESYTPDPLPSDPVLPSSSFFQNEPNDPDSPTVQDEPNFLNEEELLHGVGGDAALAEGDESDLLYFPSDPPASEIPLCPYLPIRMQVDEFLAEADGSSSPIESIRGPEFRLQRLIEANQQLNLRRFRSSHPSDAESSGSAAAAEQLMLGIVASHRALEATQKHRRLAEGIAVEGSEQKIRSAANFECNICLDMAMDPVVSSCGHLFCWPCLYQWLHLHSDHNECPVCRGHVTEAKVTPIYGRGSLERTVEMKCGENSVKIPPRPRGHRSESLRHEGGHLLSILDGARRMILDRLREWRTRREEENAESGSNTGGRRLPRNNTSDPQTNSSTTGLLLLDESDNMHQTSLYDLASADRLADISADLGRMVGSFVSGSSQAGTSTSSVHHHNPEPLLSRPPLEATLAADQASASSTMAMVQGDIAVNDAPAQPFAAEPSRGPRRGRSRTSGSLDADGGAFHAYRRRRMN